MTGIRKASKQYYSKRYARIPFFGISGKSSKNAATMVDRSYVLQMCVMLSIALVGTGSKPKDVLRAFHFESSWTISYNTL
jgi:hypothetical protein